MISFTNWATVLRDFNFTNFEEKTLRANKNLKKEGNHRWGSKEKEEFKNE